MLKVVTFNIRCDFNQDGDNCFCYRKSLIQDKIKKESPDIICFQEVLPHVAVWLKEALDDYYVIGCGRSETLEDEQMAVAYRKDRWNLISMETFWLSPTPYVPASRYEEQSICPRTCTEAVFEDLQEKKILRVNNLHLDHEGMAARKLGLVQVLKKVDAAQLFPDAPVILTGDFNAEPDAEEIRVIEEWPEYENAVEEVGITYHGYGASKGQGQIDHMYIRNRESAKDRLVCRAVGKWEDKQDGVWLSDHYPVWAELEWN